MTDIERHLSDLEHQTVLCVGDVMLDEFVYGEVSRISPEAPTPVIACRRSERMVGGAGNVARNLVGLGTRCIFVGVVGDDLTGRAVQERLAREPLIEARLVLETSRPTTRKIRFVSEHHSAHMLRADWEVNTPISKASEDAIIAHAQTALSRVGAVVLSDYAKGTLTARVIGSIIAATRESGKPLIVDPKGPDYSVYKGATVITPNRQELAQAVNRTLHTDADVSIAAGQLRSSLCAEAVLVTRSEAGMTLVHDRGTVHLPAHSVRVRDVSGAGDTVVAIFAAMLAFKAEFEVAMRAANAGAAVVVGKQGTATVTLRELRRRVLPASSLAREQKIVFDWAILDELLSEWKDKSLRVGFTNGCFDLLHSGHVRLLATARAACDRLVVGLNSDDSARRLKGFGRPVQSVSARSEVLAALEAVDLVVIFDQDTPLQLIRRIKPAVLVKGGDYTRETVVGHDFVEALGGEVLLVELVSGQSTTAMIERSSRRY